MNFARHLYSEKLNKHSTGLGQNIVTLHCIYINAYAQSVLDDQLWKDFHERNGTVPFPSKQYVNRSWGKGGRKRVWCVRRMDVLVLFAGCIWKAVARKSLDDNISLHNTQRKTWYQYIIDCDGEELSSFLSPLFQNWKEVLLLNNQGRGTPASVCLSLVLTWNYQIACRIYSKQCMLFLNILPSPLPPPLLHAQNNNFMDHCYYITIP